MAQPSRLVTLVAVVVLAAACGAPAVTPAAKASTTSSSAAARPEAKPAAVVPMVLETGAPLRPPIVNLVVDSGGHEVVQRGVLYVADFATRVAHFERYSTFPVPWSAPSTVETQSDATLAFDSDIAPDEVSIKSYTVVDSFDRVPAFEVKEAFSCKRFEPPRCKVANTDGGIRILGIGPALFTGGYISVFVVWHVPLKDQSNVADPTDSVTGTWLFRFEGKDRMEAPSS
jgi:hypothetical protein